MRDGSDPHHQGLVLSLYRPDPHKPLRPRAPRYVLSSPQHTPSGAGLGWIWALSNTPLPRVAVPGRLLQSRCVPCPRSLVACQTKPNPPPRSLGADLSPQLPNFIPCSSQIRLMRWGVGGPRRVACRFLSLSSQTRDQTQPTAGSKPQIPNHWTARELLKLKKTKIMASGPITSWQIDRGKVEILADFIFLGSKITADGDCSHEIKRCLLLGRKAMTNLDSILKRRDIILLTKVRVAKAMVFLVVMYGCESWTIKKAER